MCRGTGGTRGECPRKACQRILHRGGPGREGGEEGGKEGTREVEQYSPCVLRVLGRFSSFVKRTFPSFPPFLLPSLPCPRYPSRAIPPPLGTSPSLPASAKSPVAPHSSSLPPSFSSSWSCFIRRRARAWSSPSPSSNP